MANKRNLGNDDDYNFDEFNDDDFNFDDDMDYDDPDDRKPRSTLSRFSRSLRDDALSPQARRQLLRDSIPSEYHNTLNAMDSIAEAGSNLYNDSVMKEWEKSRSAIKKATRINAATLRKIKLGFIADWAEKEEYSGGFDQNLDELEVTSQMGVFGKSLREALNESRESQRREREEEVELESRQAEDDREETRNFRDTSIKQGTANFGVMREVRDLIGRQVDYQDQIAFNFHRQSIRTGIQQLLTQRKILELTALHRAETKDGLAAITKNTGLPDYAKITTEENVKRVLRDRFVNKASDWMGSKMGPIARSFMRQTQTNITNLGQTMRDGIESYIDMAEMGQDMGQSQGSMFTDILMDAASGKIRGAASKRLGGLIRKRVSGNERASRIFDLLESGIADSGTFANMAMQGRSGFGLLDRLMEAGGYSGMMREGVNNRIFNSAEGKLDEAAYMSNKFKLSVEEVIPGLLGQLVRIAEATHKGVGIDQVPERKFDFRFNRFRDVKDMQYEFDNETFNEEKIKSYQDGMDRWIDQLDPDHTLSEEARRTVRGWLIQNHASGKESFATSLYRGEGLPKGTSVAVKKELESKIPDLAGFDPVKVDKLEGKEGVDLELSIRRTNPAYSRRSKHLANVDGDSRNRMPIDNEKLSKMTERFGPEALVRSKLGRYDAEGNISLNNDALFEMLQGGVKEYKQRNEYDADGNLVDLGANSTYDSEDGARSPYKRINSATNPGTYKNWFADQLKRMNGIRGFAKGGITEGAPDKIAGVTHGGEAVINSSATKENKRLLHAVNKLSAPFVLANGKINRVYYAALGLKGPEDVDEMNDFKSKGWMRDALHNNFQGGKVFDYLKGGLQQKGKQLWYKDGYNPNYMGPVPEFMGPQRAGGLRNTTFNLATGARNLVMTPDAQGNYFNREHRAAQAKDLSMRVRHGIADYDYAGAIARGKATASDYKSRAKAALERANTSQSVDWDATRLAIDKTIQEEGLDEGELQSLYLQGMNSPFITKGDFAVGRYRNKATGKVITKPSDIMDDIVLVDSNGQIRVIATMADMLEGVFDGRGKPVRLIGIEAGHRRYLKRTTAAGRAIKDSTAGKIVLGIKDKVWDDIPIDIYTIMDGKLHLTLQATMFKAGLYRDKESGDILKTHNDIQGEVVNAAGEVQLSLEELAGGLYDSKGERVKISHLKHLRNKVVGKIENKFRQLKAKVTDKVLGKGLSFLEGAQQNEVYVMRWKGSGRELTLAFTMDDLEQGNLIDRATATVITKLSDIKGPVYSKRTKSLVVKEDELKHGLLDANGKPLKDFKNMSIADRIKHQQDRAYNKLAGIGQRGMQSFRKGWAATRTELKGGITDIYVSGDTEPRISSTALAEGKYVSVGADGTVNTVKAYKDIIGPVWENFGESNQRIVLSTDDLNKGLCDSHGNVLHVKIASDAKSQGFLGRVASKLGGKVMAKIKANMPEMKDLYLPEDMSAPALLATKLNAGKYINILTRKVVISYADLKGGVTDSEDPTKLLSDSQVSQLVLADGTPISAMKKVGKAKALASSLLGGIKSKFSGLRMGSWQWKRAKKEEEERNKKGDVTVNVGDNGKEKKGFLGKLLAGLATTFGTMFGGMMMRFGKMFKKLRNAIMISKLASGAGGALSGAAGGAAAGGRGRLGMLAKVAGLGLTAYGGYHAYNAMGGMGDEGDEEDLTPEQEKALVAQQQAQENPGFFSKAMELDNSTGNIASTAALMAGGSYLGGKIFNRGGAQAAGAAARPGLMSRLGTGARNIGSATANALGRGASNAGSAAAGAGRTGGAIGRFLGRRVPGLANVGAKVGSAIGKGLWKMGKPLGVKNLAKGAAMLGRGALAVGRVGLMAARVLSGPVGWGLMAAAWIGGKLYDNYKNKQNPIMRFRIAQYGFDFSEQDTTAKLLDLENLVKDHVSVGGKGGPAIKDSIPEDKVLELFEINPEDPEQQPHMERFIAWWQRRFKPIYLSHVKQMYQILKKTDLSSLDEELSKKDKLDLLSKVHFAAPGNNPYMVSASPFADPEEVTFTIDDVNDAYKKAIKFVNKMPDDKKTQDVKNQVDENGKPVEKKDHNSTWWSSTKKGIELMVDKSLSLTKTLAGKTSEIFNDWYGSATDKIKGLWDGAVSWFDDATSKLTDKISSALNKITSIASSVGGTVGDAVATGTSMIGAGINAAGNFLTGASGNAEQNLLTMAMKAGVTDPTELAMFMGQVAHESGNFKYSKEIASGKAYEGRKDLGNTNPGDGVKYKGRGWIQITGKANYAALSKWAGKDFVANPELLEKEPYASMAAVWYWTQHGNMTRRGRAAAQRGDIVGATKAVNGGTNGLQDRQKKYNEYLQKIGKDPNAYLAKLGGVSAAAAAAAGGAGGGGSTGGAPMAPGTGPLQSSQGPKKQYVSQKEFDALQKAAPKPPMMASKEVHAEWEKNEKARKEKLASIQKGIVSGTHAVGVPPKPDYNANGAPEASTSSANKQQAQMQTASQPMNGQEPPWMRIAKGELGNGETKNVDRANQYFQIHGLNYDVRKTAWCAAFASWCLKNAGYDTSKDIVRALGYSDYGKGLSKDNIPYGAICVVRSHVFFCAGVENGRVKALGGNQGNPGSVTISSFPIKDLVAVRWPEGAAQGAAASPSSTGYVASTQLGQPQQQRPDYNAGRQQEAGGANNAATSGGGFASTTQAQQQRKQATQQAQDASSDQNVWNSVLDENRKQTGLLTEIRDHLAGVKTNTRDAADRPVSNNDEISKNVSAATQLMTSAVQAFGAALKQSKQDKVNYPVSARK